MDYNLLHSSSDSDDEIPLEAKGPHQSKDTYAEFQTAAIGKPCRPQCKKHCLQKINDKRRKVIWRTYWELPYNEKRAWLFNLVSQHEVRNASARGNKSRRSKTYAYNLRDGEGRLQHVCKTFFLTTLGYHPKNDRLIVTVMGTASSGLAPNTDQRGRHVPSNKLNMDPIFEHIESFSTCKSQEACEHAPLESHLPSHVNIRMMHADYQERNTDSSCSYETYRKAVRQKTRVSKLEADTCEICSQQNLQATMGDGTAVTAKESGAHNTA